MPFLTACVYEAARLYPSVPVIIPRRVSAGGIVLNGHYISEGTSIGASPAIINRNKAIFGLAPNVYRPERWLEQIDEELAQMHRYLFSWGFGSRKCPGMELAVMMTLKLCFQLFLDFELAPASAKSDRSEDKGFALYEDLDIHLTIKGN
ncbi:MAG: hypothetical protein Q9209_001278 [Squamulea sp. 1 TL-2023]